MRDSDLIRRYLLDPAGIMFVTGLIKDLLTSQTPHWNAMVPEIDIISTLTYLQLEKCKYAAVMIWVYIWQHLQNRIVSLFIYYKIR